MTGNCPSVEELAGRKPGEDPDSPYEDLETSLPDWWEDRIAEFQRYGLRPYRPPRLNDGTFLPPLIMRLEWELDVDIRLMGFAPELGSSWTVLIDEEPVIEVNRYRHQQGYSVFTMETDEFVEQLRDHVRS